MKRIIGPAIAAIVIAFALASHSAFGQEKETIKDPVARVNGVKISSKEYEREVDLQLQQAAQQGRVIPEGMLPKVKEDILNNMIDREVLYQESQKKKIAVNAEEVNNQIKTIKDRFSSQEEFEKVIAAMGVSEAEIRSQIERNLAIRELIDTQVINKIQVSESDTKVYYN